MVVYYDVMFGINLWVVVKFIEGVVSYEDKSVLNWVKVELKFVEVCKVLFELSFIGFDGLVVDVVMLCGKVVCLFFWLFVMKDLLVKVEDLCVSIM